jgi:preprotein translocase subunit YajC
MVDFAYAAALSPNGGGSGAVMTQVLFFAAIFAIFYFLLIRPQQRQKREREATLGAVKKGDRVVTASGVHGTVVGLNEHTMTLKVADQVRMDFDRSALGRIVPVQGGKESGS